MEEKYVAVAASLRAKMRVSSVTQSMGIDGKVESETIKLQAVYGKEGSTNQAWSNFTPSADVSLTITNPSAIGKVMKGKFYFIDFIETDVVS